MRTRIYRSKCETVELTYKGNNLKRITVLKEDKVSFEGIRHRIHIYRKELETSYFILVSSNHIQAVLNSDINLSRSAQFIGWVIALGSLANLALVLYSYQMFWLAIGSGLLFVLGVSALFFRHGNR